MDALTLARISDIAYDQSPAIKDGCAKYGFDSFLFFGQEYPAPAGFIAENQIDSVVCFRGSDSLRDVLTDFTTFQSPFPIGGRVHDGFKNDLNFFWLELKQAVAQRTTTIWCCGHSLGAALATLAVADCIVSKIQIAGLYTYGSPRCGDSEFSNAFKTKYSNSYRYVFQHDIVPNMPPSLLGWRHVSTTIGLGNQSWGIWSITDHSILNYIKALQTSVS